MARRHWAYTQWTRRASRSAAWTSSATRCGSQPPPQEIVDRVHAQAALDADTAITDVLNVLSGWHDEARAVEQASVTRMKEEEEEEEKEEEEAEE